MRRPLLLANAMALALTLAACSAQPGSQAPPAPAAQHPHCLLP
jgi:hypothetical protein